jgi:hypothetical protein
MTSARTLIVDDERKNRPEKDSILKVEYSLKFRYKVSIIR